MKYAKAKPILFFYFQGITENVFPRGGEDLPLPLKNNIF